MKKSIIRWIIFFVGILLAGAFCHTKSPLYSFLIADLVLGFLVGYFMQGFINWLLDENK